jgi:acid phosphatase (class A)
MDRMNSTHGSRFSFLPHRPVLILLALAACLAPLQAQPSYLPAGEPDGVALLAPPPLPGSAEQAADLASVIAVFNARTPREEALARSERKFSIFAFAPAIGSFFQSGKAPQTEAFFKRIEQETAAVTDAAKDYWKRPRPYMVEPGLAKAGGEMEKSFSYPSGHSTRATVLALLLAELFPDRQEAILAVGRNIGWHRVEIGRHYPTDIYAGRALAQAIVRALKASPAFRDDFAKIKAELARMESSESHAPIAVGSSAVPANP